MKKTTTYSYLLVILFLTLCSLHLKAQETSKQDDNLWDMIKYDGVSIFNSTIHPFTRPFHWNGKDWLTMGLITAGTGVVYTLDEPAKDFFLDNGEHIPPFIKDFGFRAGKPLVNYGFTSGVYAIGLFTKNEKIRKTGVLMIASATAGGLIQTVSKTVVGRARPQTGKGKNYFKFYSEEAGYHSFPSGHSILSFTTFYAISKQFENPYIKTGLWTLGLISPVSRLWAGAHWLTDVGLGITLSVLIVDSIDNYLTKKERYTTKPNKNISWNLNIQRNQIGITGRF